MEDANPEWLHTALIAGCDLDVLDRAMATGKRPSSIGTRAMVAAKKPLPDNYIAPKLNDHPPCSLLKDSTATSVAPRGMSIK